MHVGGCRVKRTIEMDVKCSVKEACLGLSLSIMAFYSIPIPDSPLQLSQDTLGTGSFDALGVVILGGVKDLAVLNNDGKASSSLTKVPSNLATELGVLVGHEQLSIWLVPCHDKAQIRRDNLQWSRP